MKLNNKINYLTLQTLIATTFVACSSGPQIQDFEATANPNDEVQKLGAEMKVATVEEYAILSPENFQQARDSYNEAKESLSKKDQAKATLHSVAESRAYLARSREFSKISQENLKEVLGAREQAMRANAPKLLKEDFKESEDNLRDRTENIEDNDVKSATKKSNELQLTYLDLELRAIKESNLSHAKSTIEQARKEGAKELAPISLAKAEKSVQDTDAFITANRHEVAQISSRFHETSDSADHLLKITRRAKSGGQNTAEVSALKLEGEQMKVADTQNQLDAKHDQVIQGQNEILGLQTEQALTQRFENARSQFNPNEAEVYKQGNSLMIRLKTLQFPVAQAVLTGANFPLLAKVQKIIKDFGKGSVVVQGHTDSNGGKVLNSKLSSERASAVREYLMANSNGQEIDIKAIGYDYQKPLATNKTAAGRAQNRRVDIVIQPNDETKTYTN